MNHPLTVIYLGNFQPPHSSENHLAQALRNNGHFVLPLQENDPETFLRMSNRGTWPANPDFILWTRTGWDWNSIFGNNGEQIAHGLQRAMLGQAQKHGVPTVGYHLDVWWGLPRVTQLSEPFFQCDFVCTADGGHQEEFADYGINHHWFPPGVSRQECELGMFRDEFHSKLAFVGSWQGHYHPEHQHRFELVAWLKKNFHNECEFYPKMGQPAARGADLRDLYASVDVVIGDSCFAGSGLANYWSDRIPETLGRGGYLLHPNVPGLEDHFALGHHLETWDAGDWNTLGALILQGLDEAEGRREVALAGREHVLEHHTYDVRMKQLVELLGREAWS